MGYSVPAAMGAKVAEPDAHGVGDRRRRLLPDDQPGAGDLRHQRHPDQGRDHQQLLSLGMVRQWQTLFYNERYSNTDLHTSSHQRIPDFVKLAEAYGCLGLRCGDAGGRRRRRSRGAGGQRPPGRHRLHRPPRTPWCGRWSPPGSATTRSSTPAARPPCGTGRTERNATMSKHTLSVLVEDKPGVLARIAGAVLAARLQHRLPRGRPDRAPRHLPDDGRRRRRGAPARAGHQAAQQAGRGAQGRRARPERVGAASGRARQGACRRRPPERASSRPWSCSAPRSSTSRTTP